MNPLATTRKNNTMISSTEIKKFEAKLKKMSPEKAQEAVLNDITKGVRRAEDESISLEMQIMRALPYITKHKKYTLGDSKTYEVLLKKRAAIRDYLFENANCSRRYIIETLSRVFRDMLLFANPKSFTSRKPSPRENKAAKSLLATVRKTHKGMSLEELAKLLRATSTLAAKKAKEERALKQSKVVATTKKVA